MVPSGLLHYEFMKVEMDKNFRRDLKIVTKVKVLLSPRQEGYFYVEQEDIFPEPSVFSSSLCVHLTTFCSFNQMTRFCPWIGYS